MNSGLDVIVIFDTDVMVWLQRGNSKADTLVYKSDRRALSIQSYMELLQGAKHKGQHLAIQNAIRDIGFDILPLSENIGHRALVYIEQFSLSHDLRSADAIIAATAVENGLPLVTGNVKHFRPIADLRLIPFRP